MLVVKAKNSVQAWREVLTRLYREGTNTDNSKYFRDELVVVELTAPAPEPSDSLFPMSQKDLNVINHFITTGENEESICHEWTKLYYHRMFDEPNSQMRYIIEKLKLAEPVGEAQISLWDKNIDQKLEISPCTQIIWARKRHEALDVHVHAHSSDAYKKLLMNLQEFISVHSYLSSKLGLKMGRYFHILDSCHIHSEDAEDSRLLIEKFARQQIASA